MNLTWTKEKRNLLSGETVVEFTIHGSDEGEKAMVVASKAGISGAFPPIESEKDLQLFAQMVSEAWTDHRKLKPKLVRNMSGH